MRLVDKCLENSGSLSFGQIVRENGEIDAELFLCALNTQLLALFELKLFGLSTNFFQRAMISQLAITQTYIMYGQIFQGTIINNSGGVILH
jgi:hypothetical protein